MAERERIRDLDGAITRLDRSTELEDLARLPEYAATPDVEMDVKNNDTKGSVPEWIGGLLPVTIAGDEACESTGLSERNCCFFYPLSYCRDLNVIGGFCAYHLRAVFNLVYQTDANYVIRNGRAVIVRKTQCFVADPQAIDDTYTAVFPIIEMFDEAPAIEDIKLFHLAKFLRATNTRDWRRVYSVHVNFLYNIVTVHRRIWEDQTMHSQLLVHWNTWNLRNSRVLRRCPADLTLIYSTSTTGTTIRIMPVSSMSTLSQMIVRLFTVPYSDMDDGAFMSTVPNYGFTTKNHLSYVNNLCSCGTTCVDGVTCLGNVATLTYLRTDRNPRSLINASVQRNCDDYRFSAKVNWNAPALSQVSMAPIC